MTRVRSPFRLLPLLLLALLSGCSALRHRTPVPENLLDAAEVPGFHDIRSWGDQINPKIQGQAVEIMRRWRDHSTATETEFDPIGGSLLALSGGSSDGAFGAGLLCGWTAHGDRPTFNLVSGVSTGALIAPFAFLGSGYDVQLKRVYTTIEQKDIVIVGGMFTIVGRLLRGDSLSDTTPLVKLVESFVTPEFLKLIAREHAKGRRLYIGTTHLDAQRVVIWDMGAIASSGSPNALSLFRDVLVASAAIPGIFPPVYLQVEANGKKYDEMHVDGGVTAEVFAYASVVDFSAAAREAGLDASPSVRLFVIRNSIMRPEYAVTPPRIAPITTRAVETLIKSQADGDIYRLYAIAKRDNLDFNLAYIPDPFQRKSLVDFDKKEMNRLFDLGYKLASKGYPWDKTPRAYHWTLPATAPSTQGTSQPAK